jgi:hypothetical protein
VSDPSFVVLRQSLLESFDRFWVENMHGNRKISEYAPDGRTSETVFAIPGFSPGIQQGVAISLWVKSGERSKKPKVLFRDDLNAARAVDRRRQLLESLEAKRFDAQYEKASPASSNRFSFRPSDVASHYLEWPRVIDLCAIAPSNGLMEKRGGALISIDRQELADRMRQYFDPRTDWETLKSLKSGLTENAARFDAKSARAKALAAEAFDEERVCRYAVRPFDARWCYFSAVRPLWNEPRPSLWAQCWKGNRFLMTRPAGVAAPEGSPFFFTRLLGDNDFLRGHAYYFPFQLKNGTRLEKKDEATLFDLLGERLEEEELAANLSPSARRYLDRFKLKDPDRDRGAAEMIWLHSLAIGYSPAYLAENADGIGQDWPRIPLPANKDLLLASAEFGRKVAALLDTETAVVGVTSGSIRAELKVIGVAATADGKPLNREAGDFDVTAGWGHGGRRGVTMPGKGKMVPRDYTAAERAAIEQSASALGLTPDLAFAHLGEQTCDVYLNGNAYWRGVPLKVWEYTIGGYQVMKKWLSYRERELLGRALTLDEVREVTNMARRIAAILLLEPALDENYRAVKANCYDWQARG